MACPIQRLLSLPPGMAREFETLEAKPRPAWFATSDPAGHKLGSGGGTAHLLAEAWRQTGAGRSFVDWLATSRKLLIHGGGQSRRLPSYAPVGKLLLPVPVFRWSYGQRLDQTLLDVQLPDYERVLAHAGPRTAAMITSGDVLLRFARELPPFPDVDVLGLGMWVTPEKARDFGVFFSPRPAHGTRVLSAKAGAGDNSEPRRTVLSSRGHGHVAAQRTRGAGADGEVRLAGGGAAICRRDRKSI
jgi:hypothetical protein